jgi:hypothetical protein
MPLLQQVLEQRWQHLWKHLGCLRLQPQLLPHQHHQQQQ